MGFSGSRRSAGQKFQKSSHEKAKAKGQKHKAGDKYLPEETPMLTLQEVSDKTLSALNKLGVQIFALSPFRQYFDDWLVSLRNVLSEFESSLAVSPDEQFVKERSQILLDVERELAERRLKEAALEESAKALSEENHRLADMDAENAAKTKEIAAKRNADIERLTKAVHDLEAELEQTGQLKTNFFSFTKKAKAKKQAEISQKLNAVKSRLELAVQNFSVEQEKLHDEYEKRKQVVIEKVQSLEKEIGNLETDGSFEARQVACFSLANAVKALVQRKAAQPQ
jgi:hypothetical protein